MVILTIFGLGGPKSRRLRYFLKVDSVGFTVKLTEIKFFSFLTGLISGPTNVRILAVFVKNGQNFIFGIFSLSGAGFIDLRVGFVGLDNDLVSSVD